MNVAILTGRLTDDITLKITELNTPITSFTVAVKRSYTKDSGNTADFIDVVAFGNTAEFIAKHFKKGQKIEIQGRMHTRTYEVDGTKRKVFEVIADKVDFGESKRAENATQPEADINGFIPISDEELPFNLDT